MTVEPCACGMTPPFPLRGGEPVDVTDDAGRRWHAERVGDEVHLLLDLEAAAAERAELEREGRIGDSLARRDRLLAALALRMSSGWSSMPAAARQRVQAVIDAAADRVRDLLA